MNFCSGERQKKIEKINKKYAILDIVIDSPIGTLTKEYA